MERFKEKPDAREIAKRKDASFFSIIKTAKEWLVLSFKNEKGEKK